MANKRLSMRKITEVLRLCWGHGLSARQAARSCGVSRPTVTEYLDRASQAGLSWPLPGDLDETTLEHRLFPSAQPLWVERRNMPDCEYLFTELKRKHVTLHLLWQEYRQAHPKGYQYSQFCVRYRAWLKTLEVALRQDYTAGEKLFVDFAGDTIPIQYPLMGRCTPATLFVATLGASNYTYAEAVAQQDLPAWISLHIHAFEFFGAVPLMVIPDNLKAGVTHPCRYEPDLNPTYQDLATHYGTTVIPARVARPKDKAKVESAVLIAERWILAALRNHTFFSLVELNQAIQEKLAEFNQRPLQKMKVSRCHRFETLDYPAMKPLPASRYEYATWVKTRVNIDYHVEVEHHYYSVPHQLKGQVVDARLTATTVELLFKGKRVASHARSQVAGAQTTVPAHRPESHRRYLEWTPSRILTWADQTGNATGVLARQIMERKPHPEQGFRSCLGLMRLERRYGAARLNAACARALLLQAYSYKSVQSILKHHLEDQETAFLQPLVTVAHANLRGSTYYAKGEPHAH